jgi:hypothetical protein
MSILDDDLLPESGDYSAAEEPAIEEIELHGGRTTSAAPAGGGRGDELSEISLMAEEGVLPMTSAPDDTSYLEGEVPLDLSAGGGGLPGIDLGETTLEEMPLVEPDLSDFDLEAEDISSAPLAEIDEELPVFEPSGDELPSDLTLSVEAGAGYEADRQPMELEELTEAIPEIDEDSLGEISLHEEASRASGMEELPDLEEFMPADGESDRLAREIDEKTVKPSEPVSLHPDEIPMSLDDSFFVDSAEAQDGLEVMGELETPEPEDFATLPEAEELVEPAAARAPAPKAKPSAKSTAGVKAPANRDERLKAEVASILSYLDKLLDSLPEDKIEEFAHSEYFETYKRLFEELGLV